MGWTFCCHVGIIVSGARQKRKIDEDDPHSEQVADVLIRFCTPVADRFESQIWFDLDGDNAFFIDEFVLLEKFTINVCEKTQTNQFTTMLDYVSLACRNC